MVTHTQRKNSAGTGCPVGGADLQKEGANPQCPDLQRAQGISTEFHSLLAFRSHSDTSHGPNPVEVCGQRISLIQSTRVRFQGPEPRAEETGKKKTFNTEHKPIPSVTDILATGQNKIRNIISSKTQSIYH